MIIFPKFGVDWFDLSVRELVHLVHFQFMEKLVTRLAEVSCSYDVAACVLNFCFEEFSINSAIVALPDIGLTDDFPNDVPAFISLVVDVFDVNNLLSDSSGVFFLN